MKDDEKYQELFNALFIKYGIEPDEEWTNIEWKILIDSKLDTKQRDLFYNELVNLDLNYKGWTRHSTKGPTQEEIEQNNSSISNPETHNSEYLKFISSLLDKYEIETPGERFSNAQWTKVINDELTNEQRDKFYNELVKFKHINPDEELEQIKAEKVKSEKLKAQKVIIEAQIDTTNKEKEFKVN